MTQPALVQPSAPVFRVARSAAVWTWPDWDHAQRDRTFGQRWDDPSGEYRVLYASSSPFGALLETLAPLRPDLRLTAELEGIAGSDQEYVTAGAVPVEWLSTRWLGEAELSGTYIDIGAAESLAWMRPQLAGTALALEVAEIDAGSIRLGAPRAFTQAIARLVYEHRPSDGQRHQGIRYQSRYDDATTNWAVFTHVGDASASPLREVSVSPLSPDHPDLARVFAVLGLHLV